MNRIIGRYTENKKGPLLFVIGGIHGNEPAGVKAIDLVSKMLEVEHIKNDGFVFNGTFLGIVGNLRAYKKNVRFIKKDLNRIWSKEHLDKIHSSHSSKLDAEDREMLEILSVINHELSTHDYTRMLVLDLHTTSSHGGIFTIPNNFKDSQHIASQLHAPVVKGMLKGIKNTTLHYFKSAHFPIKTTAVTFESGQHEDPLSINRAVSAIINCMRSIGSVVESDVENIHDKILRKFSEKLPKSTKLVKRHAIEAMAGFEMLPGFKNFQQVKKGELIARDKNGDIFSPADGRILMPLYQKQGEDGFFIIKEEKK
jgi:succinylglutamate desuccinylase